MTGKALGNSDHLVHSEASPRYSKDMLQYRQGIVVMLKIPFHSRYIYDKSIGADFQTTGGVANVLNFHYHGG